MIEGSALSALLLPMLQVRGSELDLHIEIVRFLFNKPFKHMAVQYCQTGYSHLFARAFKHSIGSSRIFDAV